MKEFATRVITADFEDEMSAVTAAVEELAKGEVVALPTETVYGLAADATQDEAVAKIFEVKERPSFDPLIVHVDSIEMASEIAEIPEEVEPTLRKLMSKFWPGPLTIVLPKKAGLSDLVTSGLETVALRCPKSPIMRKVMKKLGRPLAAPSANRFGRISPTSAMAVRKELDGRIPLIVNGGACIEGLESTIVSVAPNPEQGKKDLIQILRYGPVTREDLRDYGKVIKAKPILDQQKPLAPGQLASHYAPVTPFRLIEKWEDFKAEDGKTYGLLSYSGDKKGYQSKFRWKAVEILSPGTGKQVEAAVRLFYSMRQLDESGVDEIIAEPCSDRGLGAAIMDRLRRAAAQ